MTDLPAPVTQRLDWLEADASAQRTAILKLEREVKRLRIGGAILAAAIRAVAGEGRQRPLMHLDPSDTRTHIIDESSDLVGLQDTSEKDRQP